MFMFTSRIYTFGLTFIDLKADDSIEASEFEMQVFIKPFSPLQTLLKLDIK